MASENKMEADIVCQMEKFTKSFSIKVVGYSLTKLARSENDHKIATFDLGGHMWAVHFSPYCSFQNSRSYKECSCSDIEMSLNVYLLTDTKTSMGLEILFRVFDHRRQRFTKDSEGSVKLVGYVSKRGDDVGFHHFMYRPLFESSGYVKDDCFLLQCSAQLVKPLHVDPRMKRVPMPSSDLYHSDLYKDFHHLYKTGEGFDVTFKVSDDMLVAHRSVLVARSPVFKAQLLSPMIETKSNCIQIEDMDPKVFKLMLHFIYTDTLPHHKEYSSEMLQHLLVAADRYGLERLKLICEDILSDGLDVSMAATTLVLAEQHNCKKLKEKCIDFVASCENLQSVIASDGFNHLMGSCPLILKDLLLKFDSRRKK